MTITLLSPGARLPHSVMDNLADAASSASESPWDGAAVRTLWQGLLAGRCQLVTSFERDGRRYYVIRDTGDAPPVASLGPREQRLAELLGAGESEKAVAYALGVTPSAISVTLRTTLTKLGLRSRADLVFLVRCMRLAEAA